MFNQTANPSHNPAVRIVIVEDDLDDRELLTRQLRKSQIDDSVKFFSEGKEALLFLSQLPPPTPFYDLIAIFLDLKLPGMRGVELLREIRKIPRVKSKPVIIITGSLDPKDFEECQDLNVAAFIRKPVTFELFSKAIIHLPHPSTTAASKSSATPSRHPE